MQKLSPNAPVLSVMAVQSIIIDMETSSTVPHSARSASPEAVNRKIRIPLLLPFSHQHPSTVQLRSSLLS